MAIRLLTKYSRSQHILQIVFVLHCRCSMNFRLLLRLFFRLCLAEQRHFQLYSTVTAMIFTVVRINLSSSLHRMRFQRARDLELISFHCFGSRAATRPTTLAVQTELTGRVSDTTALTHCCLYFHQDSPTHYHVF